MILVNKVYPQAGNVFEPGCFDENLGREIDVIYQEGASRGTIIKVEVAEDGSCAWFTVDLPGVGSDTTDIGPVFLRAQEGPGFSGYAEEGI